MDNILDTNDVVQMRYQAVNVYYCYKCGRAAIDRWLLVGSGERPITWYEIRNNKQGDNMQAIGKNIVVKPVKDDEEKKIGSIFVPGNASEILKKGEIVSIGGGVFQDYNPELCIEDIVVFYGTSGIPLQFEDKEYLIIQLGDILISE